MVTVIRNGKAVAQSKNLRVITRYAREQCTRIISVHIAMNQDGSGEYTVKYSNGAHCDGSFASYTIMCEFFARKAHGALELASLYVNNQHVSRF